MVRASGMDKAFWGPSGSAAAGSSACTAAGSPPGPSRLPAALSADPRRATRERMANLAHSAGGFLDPLERAVLEGVFVHGHTCAELARLRGKGCPTPGPEAAPAPSPVAAVRRSARAGANPPQVISEARRLRRMLGRVVVRVLSAEFVYVARLMSAGESGAGHPGWSPTRRAVAAAIYLRGLSVRAAARELGISQHLVRSHRDAVRAMAEAGRSGSGGGAA